MEAPRTAARNANSVEGGHVRFIAGDTGLWRGHGGF